MKQIDEAIEVFEALKEHWRQLHDEHIDEYLDFGLAALRDVANRDGQSCSHWGIFYINN